MLTRASHLALAVCKGARKIGPSLTIFSPNQSATSYCVFRNRWDIKTKQKIKKWRLNCRPSFISPQFFRVHLGVRNCELFLCFTAFCFLGFIVLIPLFSVCFTSPGSLNNRFLHRGWEVFHRRLRLNMWGVRWNLNFIREWYEYDLFYQDRYF